MKIGKMNIGLTSKVTNKVSCCLVRFIFSLRKTPKFYRNQHNLNVLYLIDMEINQMTKQNTVFQFDLLSWSLCIYLNEISFWSQWTIYVGHQYHVEELHCQHNLL